VTIELRDLRWAIVASQHRSLRRAAEALNVRQSTLSRRLRDLEDRLESTFFERTNGGTRLTSAGQDFLEAALRIIEEMDSITARLATRSRGEAGRLVIGVQSSLSTGNLRATLIEHHRRYPHVEILLVDGSGDHLISGLAKSTIDVAFIVEENQRWDGRSLPVWSERVVAALSERHHLAAGEVIHWYDLREETILIPQRGPGVEILQILTGKNGYPGAREIRRQDTSLDRLLTLVGAGLGILLALDGATGVNYQGVVFREVHDQHGPSRLSFNSIWRNNNLNPCLGTFLDIVRERHPDLSSLSMRD
jgi:DNA-binding transcriptional LysR family regulator